ncbi:MAG: hypothetical protein M0Q23_04705 [Syntrophales bacterium]|jgi:hypothetical protein|nr:hypothetical protein [Syntrophales bacterium]MCK9527941.1 hypothetical protein [Syntrophales bacterium]MDX9921884.1 hypothetical protein [Syntrophales bacterium]
MESYVHKDIGCEIRSISGYVVCLEEKRLRFGDRDVLYAVGVGVVDNSCCGVGGCMFVEVPGYVVSWQEGFDDEGRAITMVELVDGGDREEIRALLLRLYPHSQINFRE